MTLKTVLKNFLNHVETFETRKTLGDDPYEQEFQKLKELTEKLKHDPDYATTQGLRDVNHRKNRYKDILPYDYTRVILSEYPGVPGSDYINANHIKGASGSLAYIASQGPLPNTVVDFWRMIWECEVQVIVMACNERESGKYKCECYWPLEEEKRQYGNITVELVKWRQVCPDFLVRTLRTRYGNDERTVCQFHYASWPDHGVPTSVQPILELVRLVRDCQASEALPVLVHCSAGCGRTGTICAIDYVWGLMRMGKLTDNFSLFQIISDMRRQRIAMVQTKEQYVLVHRAVAALFEQQMRVIDTHTYENLDEDGEPLILKEMKQEEEGVYEEIYLQELPEKKDQDEKEIDKEGNKMHEDGRERSPMKNVQIQKNEVRTNNMEAENKIINNYSKESTPESTESQQESSTPIANSSGCDGSREESETDQETNRAAQRNSNILIKLRKEESIKRLISDWNQAAEHSIITETKEKTNEVLLEHDKDEHSQPTSGQEAANNVTHVEMDAEKLSSEISNPSVSVKVRSFSASEAMSKSETKSEVEPSDDAVFEDYRPTSAESVQPKVTLPKKTSHVERIVGKATVIRRPSIAKLKALFEKSHGTDADPSTPVEHPRRRRPLSRSHSHHLARGQMESGTSFSLNTVPIRTSSVKEHKPQIGVKNAAEGALGLHPQYLGRENQGYTSNIPVCDPHNNPQQREMIQDVRSNVARLQVKRSEHENVDCNTPISQNRQKDVRAHSSLQRSASEIGRQKSHWYVSEMNQEHAIEDPINDAGRNNHSSKLSALNCFNSGTEHAYVDGGSPQTAIWYSQPEGSPKCSPVLDKSQEVRELKEKNADSLASANTKPSICTKPSAAQLEVVPPALPIKKKVLRVSASEATRRGSISYSAPLKLKEKSVVTPLVTKQVVASNTEKHREGKDNKSNTDSSNPPSLPIKKLIGRHGSIKNSVVYQDLTVCNNRNELTASDGQNSSANSNLQSAQGKLSEYPNTQYINVNVTAKKNIELIENTLEQHPRGAIIDLTSRQSYVGECNSGNSNSDAKATDGNNASGSKNITKICLPKAVSCEFVRSSGEECIMIAAKQCSGYEPIWVNKNGLQNPGEAGNIKNDNNTSMASLSSTETLGKSSENVSEVQEKSKTKANNQDEQDADRNLLLHSPPPRSKRAHVTRSNSKPSSAALPLMAVNPSNISSDESTKKDKATSEASQNSSKDSPAPVTLHENEKQRAQKVQEKGLGRRNRTLVTSSSSSNLLDLNQNCEYRAHSSSLFSRTAFELNLETEIPLLSISTSASRNYLDHRALSLNDQNNQNLKKTGKSLTSTDTNPSHYQIYDIPSNLISPSHNHQHLKPNSQDSSYRLPCQSNKEYEYLYPLQRSASTPQYNKCKEEQASEHTSHQRIFETWAPRRSREDEYQMLAGHPQMKSDNSSSATTPNRADDLQQNAPKIIGNGPPKPPRTYDYTAPLSHSSSELKKQSVYQSPPKLDGGRLIVSVASPKRNASKHEAKPKNEANQKSEATTSPEIREKSDVTLFSNNITNHPHSNNMKSQDSLSASRSPKSQDSSSGSRTPKSQDSLSASRSPNSVPTGASLDFSLSIKPSDNPVYCVVDRQAKELQRAKSLKHDKSRHHSTYQQRKVQEYPFSYPQKSLNVTPHKNSHNSPYKSPPVIHLYENVYGCYGVTFPGPNRKDRFSSIATNRFGKDESNSTEDHSLMRLQSDSSVYAILRGEKTAPSVVMNRPAQPPSYSQVIKLKNESKLLSKDKKDAVYCNHADLEDERKDLRNHKAYRSEVTTKPVAPPRVKRQANSKQNYPQESSGVDWDFKGHSSHQKNRNMKNPVQDDDSPDSDNEGIPSVPAKTKAAYETPENSEHKKNGSSASDSNSRGGTLSRALWAKLTQLTKLGSRSADSFDSDTSKTDTDGASSGEVVEPVGDAARHGGEGGVTRSDMIFPNRIHKPSGPRESPKQWTQV